MNFILALKAMPQKLVLTLKAIEEKKKIPIRRYKDASTYH
jgi:hypothetical protein